MKTDKSESEIPSHLSVTPGTLATSVYDLMRDDILCCDLDPGSKLRSEFLRERYKVGNSPIREALNRLSSEGLVIQEDQKGFRVSNVSRSALTELIKTRCLVEEAALRESIKNGGMEWEENILLAFHRLFRVPHLSDDKKITINPEWARLHRNFHMTLISGCGSRYLLDFCGQMNDLSKRYRYMAVKVEYSERNEVDEHRAIKDAIINRKTEEAIKILHAHYHKTEKALLKAGIIKEL